VANIKSSVKRIRVSERNRIKNRAVRSALRTEVKRFRAAVESGDAKVAGELLSRAHAAIDRSAKKGVIHGRTADRYKSRLAQAHRRLTAAAG
jgi:small subunit ribosomal protein S20